MITAATSSGLRLATMRASRPPCECAMTLTFAAPVVARMSSICRSSCALRVAESLKGSTAGVKTSSSPSLASVSFTPK